MQSSSAPTSVTPSIVRLKAAGPRFDASAVRTFLADADAAIRNGARAIVIDLGALTAIDSVGITALVTVRRRAPEATAVVLAALSPALQTVARVCHIHEVFAIYTSVDAAARALGEA
jgi:anti-sigma B factor antagonist